MLTSYAPLLECFHISLSWAELDLGMGIWRMSFACCKGYRALTKPGLQKEVLWSTRSPTVPIGNLGSSRFREGHWNQLEWFRGISNPFPVHHLPSFKARWSL